MFHPLILTQIGMTGPEKIETILKNSVSTKLLTEITRLNSELNAIILDSVPPELRSDITFSHLDSGIITLLANNPVVATKARFLSPEILKKIQNKIPKQSITKIELKMALKI